MLAASRDSRRPSAVGAARAMLALLLYLLPLYGLAARSGSGGTFDRAPGIVVARCRHAQLGLVMDGRPVPQPSTAALPAGMPAVRTPDSGPCSTAGDAPGALVSRAPAPTVSRSPPLS
jgi:hypothetical protein